MSENGNYWFTAEDGARGFLKGCTSQAHEFTVGQKKATVNKITIISILCHNYSYCLAKISSLTKWSNFTVCFYHKVLERFRRWLSTLVTFVCGEMFDWDYIHCYITVTWARRFWAVGATNTVANMQEDVILKSVFIENTTYFRKILNYVVHPRWRQMQKH